VPESQQPKNGRLASLALNPLLIVHILELWAKWVNMSHRTVNPTSHTLSFKLSGVQT